MIRVSAWEGWTMGPISYLDDVALLVGYCVLGLGVGRLAAYLVTGFLRLALDRAEPIDLDR